MKNSEHDFTLPPFPGFPSAGRFVPVGPVQEAILRVARSISAREAISIVIGPPGTGKSLACALLAKQFADSRDVVVMGETSITDETSFYRFLLHRLNVALETSNRDELELMLHDRLAGEHANSNGALLIIDEAASLSSDVLEAIRRITNLMRDGQPMVSAVVVGGVRLDETLTAPSLEPFVQRVAARCYLHPLNTDEVRQYIRQSIESCDASPDETITDTALSAIYHATSGVPRLINQLMTEAIDCAADLDESLIDDHTIDKAWASLQQLPSPMVEEPAMEHESSIIEFGELTEAFPMQQEIQADDIVDSEPIAESMELDQEDIDEEAEARLEAVALGEAEDEPMWEDVIENETAESTADPIELFGDFDDEESIEVGAAVKPIARELAEVDLESMLHSEIVSLSQFASANTDSRLAQVELFAVNEEMYVDDSAQDLAQDLSVEDKEYPSVVWYDEADEQQASIEDEIKPGRDDTDLLWITEDIDVDRRSTQSPTTLTPHRIDQPSAGEAPKLTVDYREMLEKMRNQVQ